MDATTTMTATTADVILNINDHCSVTWIRTVDAAPTTAADAVPTPMTLEAVIVERRPLVRRGDGHQNPNKRLPVGAVDGLKADELEYYVHYIGHDRRLDQWVTLDRLQLDTLRAAGTMTSEGAVVVDERSVRSKTDAASAATNLEHLAIQPSMTDDSANNAADLGAPVYMGGGNFHGDSAQGEKEHEEATKVKNVEKIVMGGWEVESWYYSPFPEEYSNLGTLYVCEYCLSYMKKTRTYLQHKETCQCRRPPGKEIYRESDIAVYELDGKDHRAYCQKLCLIAKLFLDHKTLYYDTTPFYFYIVTKVDDEGSHIVGYFSKEKVSFDYAADEEVFVVAATIEEDS